MGGDLKANLPRNHQSHSVVKEPATGSIKVTSHVFRIDAVRGKLAELFPFTHPQNYCYVIVDPRRRTVKLWYHAQSAYY